MNNGSGMMRIGVTVPLISLIAIFLILNMFFGVWILAMPLAAAAALLIFFVGANRVKSPVKDLATARKNSVNLFGLAHLPRFYGFLHVFCWFIPPILFLVLWQIFGTAWMDAQRSMLNMEVVSLVVPSFEGLVIDTQGMNAATQGLLTNYLFGAELAEPFQQYAERFALAFDEKFIGRRWFWVALVIASVTLWQLTPNEYGQPVPFALGLAGLGLFAIGLALTGFFWFSLFVSIPLMVIVLNLALKPLFDRAFGVQNTMRTIALVAIGGLILLSILAAWFEFRTIQSVAGTTTQFTELNSPLVAWKLRDIALAIAALIALFTLRKQASLSPMFGKLFTLAGGVAVIVYVNHITQLGASGWIFSTALIIGSLVVLWRRGERFTLKSPITLILLVALAIFGISTIVSLADMYSWVQQFVATDFGRPPKGLMDTNGGKVDRIVAEIRNGVAITPEIIKDVRAKQAHVDAAIKWISINDAARTFVYVGLMASLVLGAFLSVLFIRPTTSARIVHERTANVILIVASAIAILVTVGLVLALLGSAETFFFRVPAQEFLNELTWSKGGINDGEGSDRKSSLGALPVFYGTMMVSFVALAFAVPVGLFSAIFLSEYANATVRNIFKPILEILAGVPTIVYGVFALLIVGPWIRELWGDVGTPITGYEMSGRSGLIAGGVMGIMLIPFISSLSDDALKAVPRPLRDGSLALGANKSETILKVLLPAALPGIMGGVLLATSRAIGETMIVVLAAGRAAKISANPLEPMTTVTVQIVEFLTGDLALDTPEALSAFGLGLVLFLATLVLNMVAIVIVRRFRLKYS